MRKLLSNGFVAFAVFTLPAPVSQELDRTPAAEVRMDPRLERLESFFGDRNCPALVVAETFLQAADLHGLDWRLLPSISFIESTGGKAARNNNLFGWDNGRTEFPSFQAAIHTVANSLANSRLYRNKNLDELLETYNPDAEYAHKVKSVMAWISPSE
jgi:hypothetical protein